MDGTILHTLPDLAIAANEALGHMGFPARTYDEIMSFMGDGGRKLIERAVPDCATAEQCEQTFQLWRSIYIGSDYAHTAPFPGIVEVVKRLRKRGIKTAVLSNKFDAGVKVLANRHFPGLFDDVRGDIEGTPRKPDPSSLLEMLDGFGVQPDDAAYVGDTNVDIWTAQNAGVMAVGVAWGYAKAVPLVRESLDVFVESAADLLGLV